MLEIFPLCLMCSWAFVAETKWEESGEWKTICWGTIRTLFFLVGTSNGQNCLSSRGCTYSVNKNEEFPWNCISVEMHDWKCVLLNCCVVVSVNLWIVKGSGRAGSQFESWRCWVVNWCEIDLHQGSHQIAYALSVFIGPSSLVSERRLRSSGQYRACDNRGNMRRENNVFV